jgi:hypothetical protein
MYSQDKSTRLSFNEKQEVHSVKDTQSVPYISPFNNEHTISQKRKQSDLYVVPDNVPISNVPITNEKTSPPSKLVNRTDSYELPMSNRKIDWESIFALLNNPEYIETINKMDKEIKTTDTNSYKVDIGDCIYIHQKEEKYDIKEFQNIPTENIEDMMDYEVPDYEVPDDEVLDDEVLDDA